MCDSWATGGGKSWTAARIIEECIEHESKIILLDATGEYREICGDHVQHCHLGRAVPDKIAKHSLDCSLPTNAFSESDFIALFRPSPGIQTPKLREALISLRIVYHDSSLGQDGFFIKTNRSYSEINSILSRPDIAAIAYNPNSPFNVEKLIGQIEKKCVWEDTNGYGRKNDQHWGYCSTLVSRIAHIINAKELKFIFKPEKSTISVTDCIDNFISKSDKRLLRICLSGVSYEFQSREIVANAIGRYILNIARDGKLKSPIIVVIDEAHNFLGHNIGSEETISHLDAFELIAKEGRKFGLSICLVTQRPRDLTESVLSQIGTLIVHRLSNDRDREVVERACGEIDRAASAFLPNLRPGEAAIIGVDFPIPLTIQIEKPSVKPKSDGPNYQKSWRAIKDK